MQATGRNPRYHPGFHGFIQNDLDRISKGDLFDGNTCIEVISDLDRSLEYCESQLLELAGIQPAPIPSSIDERLSMQGFPTDKLKQLMTYLERISLQEGEILIPGEKADDLFMVESGVLSVYLEMEGEKRMRLQTISMRTLVGELGLYTGFNQTASIVAEEACVVYRLSKTTMKKSPRKIRKPRRQSMHLLPPAWRNVWRIQRGC